MRASLTRDLRRLLGRAAVSDDPARTESYGRDLWPRTNLAAYSGRPPHSPQVVCWPETPEQVARIYRFATAHGVPVVPYGAGSGVCGGVLPLRGGITIDLKRLDRIDPPDSEYRTIVCQAGVIGEHLERALAARGFTLGHFPSSIYCSTVGGWIAARSAGQLSTRYGKFEEMVLDCRAVLPDGELVTAKSEPDRAGELPLLPLLAGSEGTLGSFVETTLRIEAAPTCRRFLGLLLPAVGAGVELIRRLMAEGWRPAAVRLYDELDTLLAGVKTSGNARPGLLSRITETHRTLPDLLVNAFLRSYRLANRAGPRLAPGALLVLGFDGEPDGVAAGLERARRLAAASGGRDLGPGPGEHWWRTRYAISYKASHVYPRGAMLDTMEVAAPWDRLMPLYHTVRAAVAPHAMVLAHFSHAYPEGCSIYFSFSAAAGGREQLVRHYRNAWRAGMTATLAAGGTISHHHGIGLLKAPWIRAEYGGAFPLFEQVKQALDPAGIANPGKLGLAPLAPCVAASGERGTPDLLRRRAAAIEIPLVDDGHAVRVADPADLCRLAALARRLRVPLATGRSGLVEGALPVIRDWRPPPRIRADSLLLETPVTLGSRDAADLLETAGLCLLPDPWDLPQWPLEAVLAGETPPLPGPFALIGERLRGVRGLQLDDRQPFEVRPAPRRAAGPDFGAFFRGVGLTGCLASHVTLALARREACWSAWLQPPDLEAGLALLRDVASGRRPLAGARLLALPDQSCWVQLVGHRETPRPTGVAAPDTRLADLFDWQPTPFGYALPRVAWQAGPARELLEDPAALHNGGVLWLVDPWRAVRVGPSAEKAWPADGPGTRLAEALAR